MSTEEKLANGRKEVRRWIRRLGIKKIPSYLPNLLTLSSIVLTALSSWLITTAHFSWGFLVFVSSQFMDVLDGAFAREYGLISEMGAFLDSTVDRVNEFLWYVGIGWYFYKTGPFWAIFIVFLSMFFAFMVSYTRAKLEGFGVNCKVGVFTRLIRIYIMSAVIVMLIYSKWAALSLMVILGLGSMASTVKRIICGVSKLRNN